MTFFANFDDLFKKKKKIPTIDQTNRCSPLPEILNWLILVVDFGFLCPALDAGKWVWGWVQNQLGLTWPVNRPNLNTLTINLDFHLETIECSCVYSIIYNMMIWYVRIRVCKTWILHYILIEFNLRKSISYHIGRYDWSLSYQCLGRNKNIAF